MAHSFNPRPGMDLKRTCREKGCTLQDLVNDALEEYLGSKKGDLRSSPAKAHARNPSELPPNFDGSPHLISVDNEGNARVNVRQSDGTTRTWIRRSGSDEWIPVARLIRYV